MPIATAVVAHQHLLLLLQGGKSSFIVFYIHLAVRHLIWNAKGVRWNPN